MIVYNNFMMLNYYSPDCMSEESKREFLLGIQTELKEIENDL